MALNSKIFTLLASLLAVFLLAGQADAKKEFVSKKSSSKSPLGEDTVTTPSGLKYKDVKVGTGLQPKPGNVVWIDYIGWVHPAGTEFDNSIKRGVPLNFVIGFGQVNKGLDEGVMSMKEQGTRLLLVPGELGFPKGTGSSAVPPGSTLKYEVKLLHVGPKYKIQAPPANTTKKAEPL